MRLVLRKVNYGVKTIITFNSFNNALNDHCIFCFCFSTIDWNQHCHNRVNASAWLVLYICAEKRVGSNDMVCGMFSTSEAA